MSSYDNMEELLATPLLNIASKISSLMIGTTDNGSLQGVSDAISEIAFDDTRLPSLMIIMNLYQGKNSLAQEDYQDGLSVLGNISEEFAETKDVAGDFLALLKPSLYQTSPLTLDNSGSSGGTSLPSFTLDLDTMVFPDFNITHIRRAVDSKIADLTDYRKMFTDRLNGMNPMIVVEKINEDLKTLRIPSFTGISLPANGDLDNSCSASALYSDFLSSAKVTTTVLEDIPPLTIDPDKLTDILVQATVDAVKESLNFDTLLQLFSGDADAVKALFAATKQGADDFTDLGIVDNNGEILATFSDFLAAQASNMPTILLDAFLSRGEEIILKELTRAPYGEICAHARAGLNLFSKEVPLLEATWYLTTRLQPDAETGQLVDLSAAHPKAREWFIEHHGKKIKPLTPYEKYYFTSFAMSLEDLKDEAMKLGEEAAKAGLDEAQCQVAHCFTGFIGVMIYGFG